uniref:Uncharacterized protein n=1 Tax=Opuntia streptacantha TaxID=393608 RepID=A0A7C9AZC0_OPUST
MDRKLEPCGTRTSLGPTRRSLLMISGVILSAASSDSSGIFSVPKNLGRKIFHVFISNTMHSRVEVTAAIHEYPNESDKTTKPQRGENEAFDSWHVLRIGCTDGVFISSILPFI